jgi:hypothetical protein
VDGLVDAGIVVLRGPLADEQRVVLATEADTEMSSAPPWRAIQGSRRTSASTRSSPGQSGSTAGA